MRRPVVLRRPATEAPEAVRKFVACGHGAVIGPDVAGRLLGVSEPLESGCPARADRLVGQGTHAAGEYTVRIRDTGRDPMGLFGPSKDEVWRRLSEEIGAEFV